MRFPIFRSRSAPVGLVALAAASLACSTAPRSTPPAPDPQPDTVRIAYLHHSTGLNVWSGGVAGFFDGYNAANGAHYQITEQWYPPASTDNMPHDYWNAWVKGNALDGLTADHEVIVLKHCFPVSDIEDGPAADTAVKTIGNYQAQYNELKTKLRAYRNTKFIVWTGAALIKGATTPDKARRARSFFAWVRDTWDEDGDNVFVWDFDTLETEGSEGGLYMNDQYASGDSHPNPDFSRRVAPYIGQRIVDVIEGRGDSGSITGRY